MEAENSIKLLATIIGAFTLIVPVISLLPQSRRPKGKSSGMAAGSRRWSGVFLMMLGFVALGVILWKPIPMQITVTAGLLLSVIGAAFYFPGVFLYFWGLVTLRTQFGVSSLLGAELYQGHVLITNGPYRFLRHPMYVGVLLAAVGALLIFKTWAMVVFLPMSLVVIGRAGREERLLEDEFGDAWQSYVTQVPKWLPRLKQKDT
jgi:protein-S-isoprenylcysteine O-methyltransferase Ste14